MVGSHAGKYHFNRMLLRVKVVNHTDNNEVWNATKHAGMNRGRQSLTKDIVTHLCKLAL